MITVEIRGRVATKTTTDLVTSGSVGQKVKFIFSGEGWDGLNKLVSFSSRDNVDQVLDDASEAVIPWECVEKPGKPLLVGIYGTNADGEVVVPTIYCNLGMIRKGVELNPSTAHKATEVVAQMLEIVTESKRLAANAEQDADEAAEKAIEAANAAKDAATSAMQTEIAANIAKNAATSARTSANTAAIQAENAARDAAAAQIAAQAAKEDADRAAAQARNASTKATEAAASAAEAAQNAGTAESKASAAAQSASLSASAASQSAADARTAQSAATQSAASAQTAQSAAQTAQGEVSKAQAAAQAAKSDADKAAAQAQTAGNKAVEAAASAAAAATSAAQAVEAVGGFSGQLESLDGRIGTATEELARQVIINKQQQADIENLKAAANGVLYREETDDAVATKKIVPSGALPYANLDAVGGACRKWNKLTYPIGEQWRSNQQSYATYTHSDGVAKLTVTKDVPYSYYAQLSMLGIEIKLELHKYFVTFEEKPAVTLSSVGLHVNGKEITKAMTAEAGVWTKFATIYTNTSLANNNRNVYLYAAPAYAPKVGEVYEFRNPLLIDLTAIFGAGNEPTSVDDPRIKEIEQRAVDNPKIDMGSIVDAPADKVVSNGKNLLNVVEMTSNTVTRGLTITKKGMNLHIRGQAEGYTSFWLNPNVRGLTKLEEGTYVFSSALGISAYTEVRNGKQTDVTTKKTVTVAKGEDVYIENVSMPIVIGQYYDMDVNIQLERGTTITPYSPYNEIHRPLPSALLDLLADKDYGIGVNADRYNYIDFTEKKYHRKVAKYVVPPNVTVNSFGNTAYSGHYGGNIPVPIYVDRDKFNKNALVSQGYNVKFANEDLTIYKGGANAAISIINDRFTTVEAFRNGINGIEIVYPLEQEEIIDLSDVIPDDFGILPVEAGGSVTMRYPDIDAYTIEVPNSVTYDIDVREATANA